MNSHSTLLASASTNQDFERERIKEKERKKEGERTILSFGMLLMSTTLIHMNKLNSTSNLCDMLWKSSHIYRRKKSCKIPIFLIYSFIRKRKRI